VFQMFGRLVVVVMAVLAKVTVDRLFQPVFSVHQKGVVVVTGASSGIGEDAAAAIHALGTYTVFAGVRKPADAARLEKAYPGMYAITLDVTSLKSIENAVETVRKTGLPLVGLVNNAGVQKDLPVELQTSASDRFTFDVNVFGLLDTTRAFIPLLRATGDGARLINVGSLAGVVSSPGSATYSASKFAVEGASDALRYELQPFGISVSLLQPGYVQSKMGEKNYPTFTTPEAAFGVTKEDYELYRKVFEGFFAEDKRLSLPENAAPTATTTTWAILDALTSARPKTRYAVASVGPFPSWFVACLKSVIPDRIMDVVLE
jgi:NAD(P)-dependent dehydrogenase (short-subunit alcohol dehydrogenase family)